MILFLFQKATGPTRFPKNKLDPKKKNITQRKLANEPKTLEELSKKYKVSRERIRQIEIKAFEKLQKSMLNSSKSKNLLPKN